MFPRWFFCSVFPKPHIYKCKEIEYSPLEIGSFFKIRDRAATNLMKTRLSWWYRIVNLQNMVPVSDNLFDDHRMVSLKSILDDDRSVNAEWASNRSKCHLLCHIRYLYDFSVSLFHTLGLRCTSWWYMLYKPLGGDKEMKEKEPRRTPIASLDRSNGMVKHEIDLLLVLADGSLPPLHNSISAR